MKEERIPWQKTLFLQWSDFKGKPDHSNEQLAWTWTKIDCPYEFNLVKKSSFYKGTFTIMKIDTISYFECLESWVKPEQLIKENQAEILKHEQGHFDIAEEHARKLKAVMQQRVIGSTFTCIGKNEDQKRDYAREKAKDILGKIFCELKPEWDRLNDEYDVNTKHGLDAVKQKEWDDRFAKLRDISSR